MNAEELGIELQYGGIESNYFIRQRQLYYHTVRSIVNFLRTYYKILETSTF